MRGEGEDKPIKTGVESRNTGADKRFKGISRCDPVSPGLREKVAGGLGLT